jgi:sigma-B regulation protein RsbU (phosphoserine phosphatase)
MKELSERRILIVDDTKANVDVLVHALKDDYKLTIALDGPAALERLKKTPADLVLLDIMMPGMDGYEVCRRLRSDPQTRDIPVLFLSALDEVKDKVAGFEAGGTDYVTKPFEVLEVRARVRSLLEARAYAEARREALAKELRIAREIQLGMVPRDFQPFRSLPVDVHAVLEPARDVGGDLYSIFPLDGGRLCIALGDVSGKGIGASLFMAITTTLLRTIARTAERPEEVLRRVNEELAADNPSGMFVTLFCGFLELETGVLRCASGGHTLPVLLAKESPPRFAFDALGTIVGIMPGVAFEGAEIRLAPGDGIVIYSDGVSEAFDKRDGQYGDERLLECLGRLQDASAKQLVEGLVESVRQFADGAPQSDDISVLAIRWTATHTSGLRSGLAAPP